MIPGPKQVRYHDGLDDTLFHCISPMSLQDRTIFTEKQHLATHVTRSPRTVSSGEQWCKFVCVRSEWFHKNKFDSMMA